MDGIVTLPEALGFTLSTQSKYYQVSRSALLEKIKEATAETTLPQDVLQDENLAGLPLLWESREQSDVNLVVAGTIIPAHKCVLVAASDYFRAMFSGDFAEACQKEVELSAITTTGIEHVLQAVYTGSMFVTDTNVLTILDTADKLQIQEIADICEDFLISGIDATNCFQLLQLSEKYTLSRLNRQIESFILLNFAAAAEHSLYPDIGVDALITFICNDDLDCKEIDIFKGVMNWFKINPEKEKLAALCDVMKHVRFTYMTSLQIKETVLCETLITQNPVCMEMIQKSLKYVTKYEEDVFSRPVMEASNPEKPRGKLSVAVILPEPDDGQDQQLRQPALPQLFLFGFTVQGIDMANLSVCESQANFVIFSMNILQMGSSLFFLGAKQLDEGRKMAKMILLRFSVQSGEWMTLCEPPFNPLVVTVSVLHNNHIYLFGGATYMNTKWIPQNTFQAGCYKYSIMNNIWTTIADYPHPVAHPAACSLGDEIFVVGGGGPTYDTRERDKVYVYNTTTNEWSARCLLNKGRSGHRVCCIGGKIYAIGGRDPFKQDIAECEVYDPEENQWSVLNSAPIPQPVASYNLLVHGDNVIVLGGGNDKDEHQTTIQTLNTSTLAWSVYNWKDDQLNFVPMGSIHTLPLIRARLSCCARSEYIPYEPAAVATPQDDHWSDNDDEFYSDDDFDGVAVGDDDNDGDGTVCSNNDVPAGNVSDDDSDD